MRILLTGLFCLLAILGRGQMAIGTVYSGSRPPIPYLSNFNFTGSIVAISAYATGAYLYKPLTNGYWIRIKVDQLSTIGSATIHAINQIETGWITNTTQWFHESDIANRIGQPSVWEYAIWLSSNGGTLYDYVGNGHGYDYEDSFTATVDGVSKTLNNGDFWTGTNIALVRRSHFIRSDIGGNNLGTNILTYGLTPTNSLSVRKQITWATNILVSQFYTSMFLVDTNGNLPIFGGGSDISGAKALTLNDGSFTNNSLQHLTYLYWGNYAICQYFTDYSAVASWGLLGGDPLIVSGVSQRTVDKKLYLSRNQLGKIESVAAGTVWDFTTYYDFLRSPNVAGLFP